MIEQRQQITQQDAILMAQQQELDELTFMLNEDKDRNAARNKVVQNNSYEKYVMKEDPRKHEQELRETTTRRLYLEKTQLEEMNADLLKEVEVLRQVADVNVNQMERNQFLVNNFRPEYKKLWDAKQKADERAKEAEETVREQNFKYLQLLDFYDAENKRVQKELDEALKNLGKE